MICHVLQCYGFVTHVVTVKEDPNVYLLCCRACAVNARNLGGKARLLEKRVS